MMPKASKVGLMILLYCLIFAEVCECRGRRGSSRGAGSRSRSRHRQTSKPRLPVTKFTPIRPTSRNTAVIRTQTKIGFHLHTARNVLVGYVTYRYLFSTAPVYRRDYQMYGRRSVRIPEGRAVRIMSTETKMLDHDENLCLAKLHWNTPQMLPADAYMVHENATIQYDNEKPAEFDGINQNFTLREKEGVDFKIMTRTQYNTTLVEGENCFAVDERVDGTVIHMYETNPYADSGPHVNVTGNATNPDGDNGSYLNATGNATNPGGASAVAVNGWLSLMTVSVVALVWSDNPYVQ